MREVNAGRHDCVVPLTGGCNFRDLGGYLAKDARMVRKGRLFRSGVLAHLAPEDQPLVQGLGIGTIIDLRTDREIVAEPTRWPHPVEVHAFGQTIENPAAHLQQGWDENTDPAEVKAFMRQSYATMPLSLLPHVRALFRTLLESESPVLLHCTAGKDRTGFCSAIILTAIGVARSDVIADYELTNSAVDLLAFTRSHAPAADQTEDGRSPVDLMPPQVREVLLSADGEFLAAALDVIAETYGSVQDYLAEAAQIDRAEQAEICSRLLR